MHSLFFLCRKEKMKHMTPNEYQKEALRTEKCGVLAVIVENEDGGAKLPIDARLLNGLMGLNGEAGECIDLLKKCFFQGHGLDCEHLVKELGDVAWYLAVSADALGYKLEDILRMNVEKLRARYPDGFESERSIYRSGDDV